jgi:hypothetical protein
MSESKDKSILLDGEDAFPDFGNHKWVAAMRIKYADNSGENTEMSARARKKKRIYKRKNTKKTSGSIS